MTQDPIQPQVALVADPETAAAYAREAQKDPLHAIHHAILAYRLGVIRETTQRVQQNPNQYTTEGQIARLLDDVWRLYRIGFGRLLAPALVDEYLRAFRRVQGGQIEQSIINGLAEQHALQIGDYFHTTSKEALLQGFNTYVNKKVAPRVALDRMLQAYGLTPRQVSGMTALKEAVPVTTARPLDLGTRLKMYVGRSIQQRLGTFAHQEEHNLTNRAKQVAWLWAAENGHLSEFAKKVWLTAKDERVCPICGPLHGQKVGVTEHFTTEDGQKIWVPGVHVNCRCEVRLQDPIRPIRKAWDAEDIREHPRGANGRFVDAHRGIVREREDRPIIESAPEEVIPTAPLEANRLTAGISTGLSAGAQRLEAGVTRLSAGEQLSADRKIDAQRRSPLNAERAAEQATHRLTTVIAERQQLEASRKEKSPGLAFRPTVKLPKPMYAVALPGDIDENGRIHLEHGTEFVADPNDPRIQRVIHEHYSSAYVSALDLLSMELRRNPVGDYEFRFKADPYHDRNAAKFAGRGREVYGVVAHDNDETLANAAINEGDKSRVLVSWWVYENGEPKEEVAETNMRARDVAQRLHADHEDPQIIELSEGWQDERQGWTTDEDFSSTRHGFESWHTSGTYMTHPTGHGGILRLEPEAENEWIRRPGE